MDIIIIADFQDRFLDRIHTLIQIGQEMPTLEPLGYTKEEFRNMFKKGHVTVLDCLEEGRILFDDGFYDQLKTEFLKAKRKGLRKTSISWLIEPLFS